MQRASRRSGEKRKYYIDFLIFPKGRMCFPFKALPAKPGTPPGRPMPHGFSIPRRRRLGVRQLAAAFMPHWIGIERINRAFKEGASKLAHSKGFASDKNYAASAGTAEPAALTGIGQRTEAREKIDGEPGKKLSFPDSPCFSFRSFLLLCTKPIERFPGED